MTEKEHPFQVSNKFDPFPAAAGGIAVGTVVVSRMLLWGKITGISGILAGIISSPKPADWTARVAFASGLFASGAAMKAADPEVLEPTEGLSLLRMATAGALVGFGSQLGNGCTSGHGVCGIGRLSPRSLVATPVFMATASLTAILTNTSQFVHKAPISAGSDSASQHTRTGLGPLAAATTVLISTLAMRRAPSQISTWANELAMGTAFGVGLCVSGMTKPSKVIGFLDFRQDWDPSLAFVMAGALGVAGVGFRAALSKAKPVLGPSFMLPTKKDIDLPLIAGSSIFGIGWGLGGICPGPGAVNAASGQLEPLVFMASLFAGFKAHQLIKRYRRQN